MIIRVVKMSFAPENVVLFEALFDERKAAIRNQEGCTHLALWRDVAASNVFFTYSHWEDEKYLDQYRASDFFKDTWAKTKALFNDKAQAWSVVEAVVVD